MRASGVSGGALVALVALGGCGGTPNVQGFESGQAGRALMGPIVGASMTDLWAPLAGAAYTPEGFGHYDGVGWAVADVPAAYGYGVADGALWASTYSGLVQVAPDGTVTDRTAELPGPLGTGAEVQLASTWDGHMVVASGVDTSGERDDFALSSIEGGVVTPLATVPAAGGLYGLIAANGPGDAYLVDYQAGQITRVRDGGIAPVALPGWAPNQPLPHIVSAGPDDAWTAWFTVDAEGQGHQHFLHDDGTGFVELPVEAWDFVEQGSVNAILPLGGGEALVLTSRITNQSGGGSSYGYYGTYYGGPVLNDMELLSQHLFADGSYSGQKRVFACEPIEGEPPCWLYPGNYGVLGDGTLVMLSEGGLLWWHGPIETL